MHLNWIEIKDRKGEEKKHYVENKVWVNYLNYFYEKNKVRFSFKFFQYFFYFKKKSRSFCVREVCSNPSTNGQWPVISLISTFEILLKKNYYRIGKK